MNKRPVEKIEVAGKLERGPKRKTSAEVADPRCAAAAESSESAEARKELKAETAEAQETQDGQWKGGESWTSWKGWRWASWRGSTGDQNAWSASNDWWGKSHDTAGAMEGEPTDRLNWGDFTVKLVPTARGFNFVVTRFKFVLAQF